MIVFLPAAELESRTLPPLIKRRSREVKNAESCGLSSEQATQLGDSIRKLISAARSVEARSLEINPLVLTRDGQISSLAETERPNDRIVSHCLIPEAVIDFAWVR